MRNLTFMIDSGAFTAWMKGTQIDIEAYADFCLQNLEYLDYVVNLDVIPGKGFGDKMVTQKDAEKACQQGWDNYEYMLERGIPADKLVHVFHQGDPFHWLDRMVKCMPYIGLSPANDRTTAQKIGWLDECMLHTTDMSGMPLLKFHGFAVTSFRVMIRYPWYSVDSSTWAILAMNGSIIVPRRKNGCWRYDVEPHVVTTSTSAIRANPNMKGHWLNLSPGMKREVQDYVESKGYAIGKSRVRHVPQGYRLRKNERWMTRKDKFSNYRCIEVIDEKGVTNDYRGRDELNMLYFKDLETHMPEWPWPFDRKRVTRGFI